VNEAGVALVVASSVAAGLGDVSVAALVFGRRSAAEAVLAPPRQPPVIDIDTRRGYFFDTSSSLHL
jgi:hypothetical protein